MTNIINHNGIINIMGSLLTAGMIGSFSLLWSMSHSLTRISDRIEIITFNTNTLQSKVEDLQRESSLLDRRLSLIELAIEENTRE